jgi:hypothetical protein
VKKNYKSSAFPFAFKGHLDTGAARPFRATAARSIKKPAKHPPAAAAARPKKNYPHRLLLLLLPLLLRRPLPLLPQLHHRHSIPPHDPRFDINHPHLPAAAAARPSRGAP